MFKYSLALLLICSVAKAETLETIAFGDAYRQILERSLRIDTQKLEVQSSEQRRLRQWGNFGPSVSLDASDARTNDPLFGGATIAGRSAALTANLNLWRSGGDVAALSASKKNLEAQNEKLQSEKQVSEDEALQALIGFISAVQRRNINGKLVQLRTESVRIARERFQRGLLALQEVDKVSIDLENARANFTDAQVREAEARAKLQTLLGHDRIAPDWPWREVIVTGRPLEEEAFRLDARPDWRSLQASLSEEGFRKRQALGSLLPTLDFQASYGNADLTVPDRRDWRSVLTLSIPLFSGLRDYTNWRLQGLSEVGAQYRVEALKREAPAEIENLRRSHKAARESAISRERTSKITNRLYEDNLQRFRLGRASVNDLALDQDRLLQSQLLEIDGWSSVHTSFAKLCHGLGGFVEPGGKCNLAPSTN